jgi:hypothetical protein
MSNREDISYKEHHAFALFVELTPLEIWYPQLVPLEIDIMTWIWISPG